VVHVTRHTKRGAPVPGAKVTISGPETREQQTGADGVARFLMLRPGDYKVKARHKKYRVKVRY
jgi:hypothetical protein